MLHICELCKKELDENDMDDRDDGWVCYACERTLHSCDRCDEYPNIHEKWELITIEDKQERWCQKTWIEILKWVQEDPKDCGERLCYYVNKHLKAKGEQVYKQ